MPRKENQRTSHCWVWHMSKNYCNTLQDWIENSVFKVIDIYIVNGWMCLMNNVYKLLFAHISIQRKTCKVTEGAQITSITLQSMCIKVEKLRVSSKRHGKCITVCTLQSMKEILGRKKALTRNRWSIFPFIPHLMQLLDQLIVSWMG